MLEYGSQIVGGVTPGKGGLKAVDDRVPVFDTVKQAKDATGADATCIFVPAGMAQDAVFEALNAQFETIVCITEGIPIHDEMVFVNAARKAGARLIGPNCPGLLTVGECKIGIMPASIFSKGFAGVVSRSGTLTYETVDLLTKAGIGQTTCVGIGGDPFPGMRFIDVLPLFEADAETKVVVLCGEVGGSDEEAAAEYIKTMSKPVVGFIAGLTAPPGKRMGHAGAIVSGSSGSPMAKVEALKAAGALVASSPADIPSLVLQALQM
jgi:succinyl-CoA synthetase alpha subunit